MIIRFVMFMLISLWAVFISSSIRSSGPGASLLGGALSTFFFCGPLMLIASIGMSWRKIVLFALVLPLFAGVAIDVYATVEETQFLEQCSKLPPTADVVFHDRWWPNGSSYLYYDPETGTLGGGD